MTPTSNARSRWSPRFRVGTDLHVGFVVKSPQPLLGLALRPTLSANSIRWDSAEVTKSFGARLDHALVSGTCQCPVLNDSRPSELRLGYVEGSHGLAVVQAGTGERTWRSRSFRNPVPEHTWALSSLFAGYGSEPAWELREYAVAVRIAELRQSAMMVD